MGGGAAERVVPQAPLASRAPAVTIREQQPGAVNTIGIRYGNTERTSLNGRNYGGGFKGAELRRIQAEFDPKVRATLMNRVYFYEQTNPSALPKSEPGITGRHVTAAQFTNLYDQGKDPDKLLAKGRAMAEQGKVVSPFSGFELAVIEAGFDGYVARAFGPSPAIVILSGRDFNVEYLGRRTAAAERLSKDPLELVPPAMLRKIMVEVEQYHEGEGVKTVRVSAETALAENQAETEAFQKLLECVSA